MKKNKFLETLRSKLLEQLSVAETAYHVQYYEEYIDSQIAGGASEEEVLESLGNPEIIAKTLLDNPDSRTHYDNVVDEKIDVEPVDEEGEQNVRYDSRPDRDYREVERAQKEKDTAVGIAVIAVIAIVAVLAIAILILTFAFHVIKVVGPIIAVVIIIGIVIGFFKNK